jgi:hypothetical protein
VPFSLVSRAALPDKAAYDELQLPQRPFFAGEHMLTTVPFFYFFFTDLRYFTCNASLAFIVPISGFVRSSRHSRVVC